MNPSFSPPPPVSNALKTKIYLEHLFDPEKNNIRVLSARHSVSIKRVDAIIRLKRLEEQWQEVSSRSLSSWLLLESFVYDDSND